MTETEKPTTKRAQFGWAKNKKLRKDDFLDDREIDKDEWPREPSEYRATGHFRRRFREYDRGPDGEKIGDTIREGDLLPAKNSCAAFRLKEGGVSYWLVVGEDYEFPGELVAVSYWPWVYDRDEALDSGYSTRYLNMIMRLNKQFFEDTRDKSLLEYLAWASEN